MVVMSAPTVHINNQHLLTMTSLNSKLQLAILNRKKGRNLIEKGFTLVELMIVIVIVGILSSVALPNFLAQTSKAKSTECTSRLGSMLSQVGSEALLSTTAANALASQLVGEADTTNCDFKDITLKTGTKVYEGSVIGIADLDKKYAAGGCVNYETSSRDIQIATGPGTAAVAAPTTASC